MEEQKLEKKVLEEIKIRPLIVPSEIGVYTINNNKSKDYKLGYESFGSDCGVDCGCGSEHGSPCPDH